MTATGCFAQPDPEPTPLFSSEEEAFAAAEETYRSYVDAVNDRREDPSSQPDPSTFLIETALEDDIDAQRQLDEAGVDIHGPTEIASSAPVDVSDDLSEARLAICLDSTKTALVDQSGEDVTPADRPELVSLEVAFVIVDGAFLINESNTRSVGAC